MAPDGTKTPTSAPALHTSRTCCRPVLAPLAQGGAGSPEADRCLQLEERFRRECVSCQLDTRRKKRTLNTSEKHTVIKAMCQTSRMESKSRVATDFSSLSSSNRTSHVDSLKDTIMQKIGTVGIFF